MGIEALIQHIEETAQKQIEEILRRAHRVKDREIQQAKKELEAWLDKEKKHLVKEKLLIISQAKSQVFKQVGLKRTLEEQKIWEDFKRSLPAYIETLEIDENYISGLIDIIKRVVKQYGLKRIEIKLNKRDRAQLLKRLPCIKNLLAIDVQVGEAIECLGGLVIEDKDSKAKFIYTIDELLSSRENFWKAELIKSLTNRDI